MKENRWTVCIILIRIYPINNIAIINILLSLIIIAIYNIAIIITANFNKCLFVTFINCNVHFCPHEIIIKQYFLEISQVNLRRISKWTTTDLFTVPFRPFVGYSSQMPPFLLWMICYSILNNFIFEIAISMYLRVR